ncbi:hypothetical protein JFQ90_004002 [Aeromonas veronii]|nr:hypothetical protein [Aeromonas veronii]
MKKSTLYSTIYSMRNIIRTIAKTLAWALGLQLVVLYLLAAVADAPLAQLVEPGLRFLVVLAVVLLSPRIFDAALRRI